MSFRIDVVEGARIAAFSLSANRLRTLLTTAGIGIGVATLLAIVGIIQGLNGSFAKQLASLGSNSLYVSKMKWGGGPSEWWESRNRKDLTVKHADAIRAQASHVTAVAPFTSTNVVVSYLSNQLSMVAATGTTEEYLGVSGYDLTTGRFLSAADVESEKPVVLLGADIVETLFPGQNPLGVTVHLDGVPFTVIGTLGRRGKMMDINFDRSVLIPYKTLLADFGKQRSMQIIVGLDSQDNLGAAQDELTEILRRARQTPPDKPDDFVINKPDQIMDLYKKITGALYAVVTGIGLITLLVGGIGIMNIMLVSVRERTREIGVRRALGARKQTIVIQFLIEAATVSAVGGTLGTIVGLGTAKVISEVTPLAAAIEPMTVALGIGFAAAVGLVFGIWPAARAANLDPVEALRYE